MLRSHGGVPGITAACSRPGCAAAAARGSEETGTFGVAVVAIAQTRFLQSPQHRVSQVAVVAAAHRDDASVRVVKPEN
jgi:hypothetical protein